VLYALGVLLSWVKPWIGAALYVAAAAMWLVPDRRMERAGRRHHKAHAKQ
jgi:hypothetical protein